MQSYPSPSAVAADSSNPFYSTSSSQQQSGLTNPDDLQLAARLSRGLAPMMNTGTGGGLPDGQEQVGQSNVNHQYDHSNQPHVTDLRSPNESIDHMGMQYGTPDGSMAPRKRSKVSRACDECRRKKIRCDATGEEEDAICSSCKRVGTRCQFSRVPMKRGPSKGYIKELADRLHTLEGVMQANDVPIAQFLPQHDNPSQQRRGSEEFSPAPHMDSMTRKRTFSATSGDLPSPYQPHRPHAGWVSQEPPRHLPHPSSSFSTPQPAPTAHMFRDPNYSPSSLQQVAQWKNPPESLRRQSSSFESMLQGAEHGSGEYTAEWDDSIVDGYYNLIHPTFPLLSSSKAHLSSQIGDCTSPLKEAFYEALHAAVRSFSPSNTVPPKQRSTKRAVQLITASQVESPSARTITTNLVHLQTMLLMAIEASNRGPPSAEAPGSALQSVWLGSAVGLAYSMKLHIGKAASDYDTDAESEEKLSRRIWWSLVIMDRWHASSSSSPLLVPESSAILYPADLAVLGDAVYHLARLSIVLGHFSAIDLVPNDLPALALPPVPILGMLMRGELERCRETLPSLLLTSSNAPLIHLTYWILSIQMLLRLPESEATEILAPAMKIVAELTQRPTFMSPLTHHATALAASTLIELMKYEPTREQADSSLKTLFEGLTVASGWDAAVKEMVLKKRHSSAGNPDPSIGKHSLLAAQGLQHLADLATATKEGAATEESRNEGELAGSDSTAVEPFRGLRAILKHGYLTSLT